MKDYETIMVHRPSLEEAELNAELQTVQDIVTNGGGEVVNVERWGKRRLAYEIQKIHEGIYSVVRFAGTPDILTEMERSFRLNERLLRHLTVVAAGPRPAPVPVAEPSDSSETETEGSSDETASAPSAGDEAPAEGTAAGDAPKTEPSPATEESPAKATESATPES